MDLGAGEPVAVTFEIGGEPEKERGRLEARAVGVVQLMKPIDDATWVEGVGEAEETATEGREARAHDHAEVDVLRGTHDAVVEDTGGLVDNRIDGHPAGFQDFFRKGC